MADAYVLRQGACAACEIDERVYSYLKSVR
jgi:hypothetical protein